MLPTHQVKNWFAELTGERLVKVSPCRDGFGSMVMLAKSKTGTAYVMKAEVFSDHHGVLAESAYFGYAKLADHQLIPNLIAVDLSLSHLPFACYIRSACRGQSILSTLEREIIPGNLAKILNQVGVFFRRYHKIEVESSGYGALAIDEFEKAIISDGCLPTIVNGVHPVPANLMMVLLNQVLALSTILRGELSSALGKITNNLSQIYSTPDLQFHPRLLHGDLNLRNLLHFNGALTGVIDGSAILGDFRQDLASLRVSILVSEALWPELKKYNLWCEFLLGYGLDSMEIDLDLQFQMWVIVCCLRRVHTAARLGVDSRSLIYEDICFKALNTVCHASSSLRSDV